MDINQEIISIIIIAVAAAIALWLVYKRFFRDDSPCDSCAHKTGCDSCSVMELKKDTDPKRLKELQEQVKNRK